MGYEHFRISCLKKQKKVIHVIKIIDKNLLGQGSVEKKLQLMFSEK